MDIDFSDPKVKRNAIMLGVAGVLFIAAIAFALRGVVGGEDAAVPTPVQEQAQQLVQELDSKRPPEPPPPEVEVVPGSGKGAMGGQ